MSVRRNRGEGAFGTIVGIVIVVLVGIALFKIVPLHIAGNKVLDAMNEQANFAGVKTLDKIQYEIFVAAQEAGTPLTPSACACADHRSIVEATPAERRAANACRGFAPEAATIERSNRSLSRTIAQTS